MHHPIPCPPGLPPLWAASDYAGTTRALILRFKDYNQRHLVKPLGAALARAVASAARFRHSPVTLVPIPSRRSAARSRGGDHVLRLARVAVHELRSMGYSATVTRALALVGRPRDSAGLSAAERAANLANAFTLAPAAGRLAARTTEARSGSSGTPQSRLIVVDDIVTSGATLSLAAEALIRCGIQVTAAAVIGATQRRHPETSALYRSSWPRRPTGRVNVGDMNRAGPARVAHPGGCPRFGSGGAPASWPTVVRTGHGCRPPPSPGAQRWAA